MTDFEVVYAHGAHRENLLISKVYAVNNYDFLLVDENGDFKWVPMRFCVLKSIWEDNHRPMSPTDDFIYGDDSTTVDFSNAYRESWSGLQAPD